MGFLDKVGDFFKDNFSGLLGFGADLFNVHSQNKINEEALDWQKAVQQEEWNRQDTAYQRTVDDLKAAGLSPLIASGGATPSGSVVASSSAVQAPRVNSDALYQLRLRNAQEQALSSESRKIDIEAGLLEPEYQLKNLQASTDAISKLADIGLKGRAFELSQKVSLHQMKMAEMTLDWDKQKVAQQIQAQKDLEKFKHTHAKELAQLQHTYDLVLTNQQYHNSRGLSMLQKDLQTILQSNELHNNQVLEQYRFQLNSILNDKTMNEAMKRQQVQTIVGGILSVIGVGVGAIFGQPVVGGAIGSALGSKLGVIGPNNPVYHP